MSGQITALKVQKRNPQRINVYLDGEYAFGLSRITAAWLHLGQELTDAKIAQLQAQDTQEVALQKALRYLEHRPRSAQEVRRKLQEKGISEETIASVIERLNTSGLVNDAQYARIWVENRSEFRPRSRRALSIELRQRGLSDDQISEAVAEVDDEALAAQAAQKYARKLQQLEWLDYRRKLSSFLARRGFSYAVIQPVVQKSWDELQLSASPSRISDEIEEMTIEDTE